MQNRTMAINDVGLTLNIKDWDISIVHTEERPIKCYILASNKATEGKIERTSDGSPQDIAKDVLALLQELSTTCGGI